MTNSLSSLRLLCALILLETSRYINYLLTYLLTYLLADNLVIIILYSTFSWSYIITFTHRRDVTQQINIRL